MRWVSGPLALHLLAGQLPVKCTEVHLKGEDAEYFVLDIPGSPKEQMSTVYVAIGSPYRSLQARQCVLKTFYDYNLVHDEAHIWINLGMHPFIVTLLWVDIIDGQTYLVLEYVEPDTKGRNSLGDFLVGPLPLATSLQWATEICIAMEYAFEKKGLVAHRDIKPNNILITADHHVKITDFGLSLAVASGVTRNHHSPRAPAFPWDRTDGMVGTRRWGTPPWMAPEQFLGIADQRSDIFSFGIVLWQMAAGKAQSPFYLPFGEGWEDWSRRTRELILTTERLPSVESPLQPIIVKCTRRDPDERYQTFSEILRELKELKQGTLGSNRLLRPGNRYVQDRQDPRSNSVV